jgi:hypothetical protein
VSCDIEPAAVWPAKDPSEKLDYAVSFERGLTRFWKPGETYTATTHVRPSKPTGFEYECTTTGQSGAREPTNWPTTEGATLTEGSVTWTCRAISALSLITTISATPTWVAPTGITVSGETISGQMAIAYIAGGQDGQEYSVLVTATCADTTIRSKACILPVKRAIRVCEG